jgi:hypothetical protein
MKAAIQAGRAARRGRVVVLLVTMAVLCWKICSRQPEPSYQGLTATEWLESPTPTRWSLGRDGDTSTAAAFRAMGPKGIRFLALALEARPIGLPQGAETFFEDLGFPD